MQEDWRKLEDIGFPKLLHRVYTKKDAFAVIEMERQKVRKKLFFKNGDPVGAKSNVLSECIGRL
ncbi:MAG: hypothetical protein HZB79_11240, partial [Deltaproteobacteria bacterium]|nr:hypothetical protein [Deltaproteobacteria bacterium]